MSTFTCRIVALATMLCGLSAATEGRAEMERLLETKAQYAWNHEGHASMGSGWGSWAENRAHGQICTHIASMVNLGQLENFVNSNSSQNIDFEHYEGLQTGMKIGIGNDKSKEEWQRWINRNNLLIVVDDVKIIPGTSGTKTWQEGWPSNKRHWKAWATMRYSLRIYGPGNSSSSSGEFVRWRVTNQTRDNRLLHVRIDRQESPGRDGSKSWHFKLEPGETGTFSGHGRSGGAPAMHISYWYRSDDAEPRGKFTVSAQRYVFTGTRGNMRIEPRPY